MQMFYVASIVAENNEVEIVKLLVSYCPSLSHLVPLPSLDKWREY